MKEIVRFSREELKIKELTGAHAVENPSSGNVMKKLGMQYIGECEYICNGGKIKTTGIVYKLALN